MNTKRLLKLADFLDTLPREKFDFGQIVVQAGKPMLEALKLGAVRCGTVACAIGWMPAVWPRSLEWRDTSFAYGHQKFPDVKLCSSGETDFDAAATWFKISYNQAEVLFAPYAAGFGLHRISGSASPKTVARRIRRFVERNAKARK